MVNCLWINKNQIKEAIKICLIQDFGAESQPQSPEFRIILKTYTHVHMGQHMRFCYFWQRQATNPQTSLQK